MVINAYCCAIKAEEKPIKIAHTYLKALDLLQNHDRLYTRSLLRSRAVYEESVSASAIRNRKILFRNIHEGTKKGDPFPG